jgi:hypothetical protein
VNESASPAAGDRAPLVYLVDPVAAGWDSGERLRQFASAIAPALGAGRDVAVVAFAHPRVAATIAPIASVLCAWEATRPMVQAAARAIVTIR